MASSRVTSTLEVTRPSTGAPLRPVRAKAAGNSRSRAAAIGIWPCNRIQPFRAPKAETMAPTATASPAQPPNISAAASANGALEPASTPAGMTPITAIVPRMYTRAVTRVPMMVERGMVRLGSVTSSAGTVADSRPMKAHSVRAAAAVTEPNTDPPLGLNPPKLPPSKNSSPTVAMASSGTSFRAVVTAWTQPPWRTPRAFTRVRAQIAATATAAASRALVARAPQKTDR